MPGSNGFNSSTDTIASDCPRRPMHARAAVAILVLGGVTFSARPGVAVAGTNASAGHPAVAAATVTGAAATATGTALDAFTLASVRVAVPVRAPASPGISAGIVAGVTAGVVAQSVSPSSEAAVGRPSLEARAKGIAPVHRSATWTLDLFDPRAERWQDPDYTACTAASTLSMLNTVSYSASAGRSASSANNGASRLVWKVTTSYARQESILAFERAHMTMLKKSKGTDAHGWRNALNYYGWGSIGAGVYVDAAYSSFEAAEKAAVAALAMYRKPVGILAAGGSHAEFITGYRVIGDDPSTGSNDFTVQGVYLTDPYSANRHRDTWITATQWERTAGSGLGSRRTWRRTRHIGTRSTAT